MKTIQKMKPNPNFLSALWDDILEKAKEEKRKEEKKRKK
jgi:hypothetical protein